MPIAANYQSVIEHRFASLLDKPIWVCWSQIVRRGQKVKLPIDPHTGRPASVAEKSTWTTYNAAQRFRRRTGLGIVLTTIGEERLIGIDLDSCRNQETGVISGWALDVISAVYSYAEISPSGTGLKVFATMADDEWQKAKALLSLGHDRLGASWKHPGGNHPPGVELYLGARYFTVTGEEHGEQALRSIPCDDVVRVMDICRTAFGGTVSSVRKRMPLRNAKGRDSSESGRAFRVCLAAVRLGIPMQDVPEWAARRSVAPSGHDYVVSTGYWLRTRNEGTQLLRDYRRAEDLVANVRHKRLPDT